jgi:DNA-damage-inducible protein J
MRKTTIISARIDPELKKNTEKVFNELGLTMTQAITLFLKQVNMRQGLPFVVAIPNAETRQALEDALAGKNLHKAENVDALCEVGGCRQEG